MQATERDRPRADRAGFWLGLLGMLVLLGIGLGTRWPCADIGDWDGRQFRPLCYSDIVWLYRVDELDRDHVPYLEARNEYPVLSGGTMWLTALAVDDGPDYLLLNGIVLSAAAVATYGLLWRLVGRRAWYFALSPTLLMYAFSNWDLLAVALATGGTFAFLRGRDRWAGVLLGMGAATKLFPGLLVVPFAWDRLQDRARGAAVRLGAWAAATWLVLNLPVAVAAFDRWSLFYRYSGTRPANWGTFWSVACHVLTDRLRCGFGPLVGILSGLLFVGGAVLAWRLRERLDPGFPRWTFAFPLLVLFLLTSKVFTPHYVLWLLPWFALVLPDVRAYVAVQVGVLAVAVTRFPYLGTLSGFDGPPLWLFDAAVVLRNLALIWCLVAWIRLPPGGSRAGSDAAPARAPAP